MTSQAPKAAQGLLRGDKKLVIAPCLEWAVVEARRRGWRQEEWTYVRGVEDLRGVSLSTQVWNHYPIDSIATLSLGELEAIEYWRSAGGKFCYPFDVDWGTPESGLRFEDIACSFERSLRERSHHL